MPSVEDEIEAPMLTRVPSSSQQKSLASRADKFPGVVLLALIPWTIYLLTSLLFAFTLQNGSFFVWITCALFLSLGFICTLVQWINEQGRGYVYLGMLVILAVLVAVLGGYYNYTIHLRPYWANISNQRYTNVLATEPATSHGDASSILFAKGVIIDSYSSMGYRAKGSMFCVAPIRDTYSKSRVEYWAIGKDCCLARGSFNCDNARSPNSRSAVVFRDIPALFVSSDEEYFRKAIQQAESTYNLVSGKRALLVRWLDDPGITQNTLWSSGMWYLVWTLLGYFIFSVVAALICNNLAARKRYSSSSSSRNS